jgi:hypothetical protein
MFHRTAAFYRDYEDKKAAQIIGDQYECTRLYSPAGFRKIAPDGTPGEWQRLPEGQRMECITRAHEIFVFCLSLALNECFEEGIRGRRRRRDIRPGRTSRSMAESTPG